MKRSIVRAKIRAIMLVSCAAITMGEFSFFPAGTNAEPLSPTAASDTGTIKGNAAIKAIGLLHLSEGKVVMEQNQIAVLSDVADPIAEAELVGTIIDIHTTSSATGDTIQGMAIFTKGFSLPAIDSPHEKESIKGTDGVERIGRIVDVTPKILRIKTPAGVQAIPVKYISEIKSPRAFAFSLPSNTASVSGALSQSPVMPSSPPLKKEEQVLVSFRPTYIPDPNKPPVPTQLSSLHSQLTARHPGKRAFTLAATAAGVAACFAIPLGVAITCPPPPR